MKKSDILRNVVNALLNKKTGRFYLKQERKKEEKEEKEEKACEEINNDILPKTSKKILKKIVRIID
jgi:hypothetical protein